MTNNNSHYPSLNEKSKFIYHEYAIEFELHHDPGPGHGHSHLHTIDANVTNEIRVLLLSVNLTWAGNRIFRRRILLMRDWVILVNLTSGGRRFIHLRCDLTGPDIQPS